MKSLVKCHLNYLISKTTIIVTAIVMIIILIGCLSAVLTIDESISYKENNYLYFNNVFMITKFIIIVFSIFLFGYSFTSKSDQYVVILISAGLKRKIIIITKIIAISIVIFIISYIAYFQYVVVGFIIYKQFIFSSDYLYAYLAIFILSVFFGLFSLLLIQKFDNIYTIIIPFSLMNLSEIINEDNSNIVKIINFLILNFSYKLEFYYSSIHAIILIIIMLVINIYYYDIKDIKN